MINLLLSFGAGALIFVPFYLWLQVWWQAFPPALIGFVAIYMYLGRRVWRQVELIMLEGQKILESLSNRQDLAKFPERKNMIIDKAIDKIKEGYALQSRQFLLGAQLDAQIGTILFGIKEDSNAALPFLERSFKKNRNWIAQAMLAIIYMKKHKPEKMEETFELAVRLSKKQDMLWNIYAWCLAKIKKTDKAIEVLGRARGILPNNRIITDNLVALQNNKEMKMKEYGDQWYQFHLEKPQVPTQFTKVARVRR